MADSNWSPNIPNVHDSEICSWVRGDRATHCDSKLSLLRVKAIKMDSEHHKRSCDHISSILQQYLSPYRWVPFNLNMDNPNSHQSPMEITCRSLSCYSARFFRNSPDLKDFQLVQLHYFFKLSGRCLYNVFVTKICGPQRQDTYRVPTDKALYTNTRVSSFALDALGWTVSWRIGLFRFTIDQTGKRLKWRAVWFVRVCIDV